MIISDRGSAARCINSLSRAQTLVRTETGGREAGDAFFAVTEAVNLRINV